MDGRHGSRNRKLGTHILNHKHKTEKVNWKWQEDGSFQSPPPWWISFFHHIRLLNGATNRKSSVSMPDSIGDTCHSNCHTNPLKLTMDATTKGEFPNCKCDYGTLGTGEA